MLAIGVVALLAAALAFSGCIVKTDLSPLKFKPVEGEDVESLEDLSSGPEEDYKSCPGFYRCVVTRALDGGDFSKCKEVVPADEKAALSEVESCRTKYCTGAGMMPGADDFDGNHLLDCLFQKCHQSLVQCAAGSGSQPCTEFVEKWEENHDGTDDCEYDYSERLCLLDYLEETAEEQVDTVGKFLSCIATKAATPGFEEDCTLHCEAGD
jgi:hypothetical protein